MKTVMQLKIDHELRLFYLKLEKNRKKILLYKRIQAELGEGFLKAAIKEV